MTPTFATLPGPEESRKAGARRLQALVARQTSGRALDHEPTAVLVERLWASACALETGDSAPGSEHDLDRELAVFFAAAFHVGASFSHVNTTAVVQLRGEERSSIVHRCGSEIVMLEVRAGLFACADRTLWTCERCGIVADAPRGVFPLGLPVQGTPHTLFERCPEGSVWVVAGVEPVGFCREPRSMPHLTEASNLVATMSRYGAWAAPRAGVHIVAAAVIWQGEHFIVRQPVLGLPPG